MDSRMDRLNTSLLRRGSCPSCSVLASVASIAKTTARIPEDAPDAGLGNEAGESVQVLKKIAFGHCQSMTRFSQEGKSSFLGKSRRLCGSEAKSGRLDKPEEANNEAH